MWEAVTEQVSIFSIHLFPPGHTQVPSTRLPNIVMESPWRKMVSIWLLHFRGVGPILAICSIRVIQEPPGLNQVFLQEDPRSRGEPLHTPMEPVPFLYLS